MVTVDDRLRILRGRIGFSQKTLQKCSEQCDRQ